MDHFLLFCISCVSFILAYLFLVALWSPAGKWLTAWLSCESSRAFSRSDRWICIMPLDVYRLAICIRLL